MTKPRNIAPSVPFSIEEHLKDPRVKEAYDALEEEFALVRQLIDLRQKRGLSQQALAKRAGMQQPAIARLESGRSTSLGMLKRVAAALDANVEVRLVTKKRKAAHTASAKANHAKRAPAKR
jgi:ribosome-binding protein aMBF1 (putative translation factor)